MKACTVCLCVGLMGLPLPTWAMRATFVTTEGAVTVELESARAPKTVETFVARARAGDYNNTLFHRLVKGFVVAGGEYQYYPERKEVGLQVSPRKAAREAFGEESTNGLKNLRGTLAAAKLSARPGDHTPTGFFFNMKDNPVLDYRRFDEPGRLMSPQGWQAVPKGAMVPGYTVFGRVVAGMDVLDRIEQGSTTQRQTHEHWPLKPVWVQRVVIQP